MKFLRAEGEGLEKFQEIIAEHGNLKVQRSDNSRQFTSKRFKQYCIENKTKQEFTAPETPP